MRWGMDSPWRRGWGATARTGEEGRIVYKLGNLPPTGSLGIVSVPGGCLSHGDAKVPSLQALLGQVGDRVLFSDFLSTQSFFI